MTDTATSPNRRFAFRFSLRMLLAAFTAFAVGFPVWYRWPYEVEEPVYHRRREGPDKSQPPRKYLVTTWQRQWGGERLKHGPERVFVDGKLQSLSYYSRGRLDGPHKRYDGSGSLRVIGQHTGNQRTGIWSQLGRQGEVVWTESWRQDVLDGPCEMMRPSGPPVRFLMEGGRIISVDGRPVRHRLQQLAEAGRIDSPRMTEGLAAPTDLDFVETPLGEGVEFLASRHELPIAIDPHHAHSDTPLTCHFSGISLATALDGIATHADHACDYRYGCIWITSADDVEDWHDPTGVAQIQPPVDSQLASFWNGPVVVQAMEHPLADVLAKTVQPLAIELDTSALIPSAAGKSAHPVTWHSAGQPFRHVLGLLLYQTRCRCQLRDETLVILPPK